MYFFLNNVAAFAFVIIYVYDHFLTESLNCCPVYFKLMCVPVFNEMVNCLQAIENNTLLTVSFAEMANKPLICTISENYSILKVLGQGSFGQVVKCVKRDTDETVAVKVLKETHPDISSIKEVRSQVKDHSNYWTLAESL